MLSKEVCKKCVINCRMAWTEDDEKQWEERSLIICLKSINNIFVETEGNPPEGCPHKLEHTVLKQG